MKLIHADTLSLRNVLTTPVTSVKETNSKKDLPTAVGSDSSYLSLLSGQMDLQKHMFLNSHHIQALTSASTAAAAFLACCYPPVADPICAKQSSYTLQYCCSHDKTQMTFCLTWCKLFWAHLIHCIEYTQSNTKSWDRFWNRGSLWTSVSKHQHALYLVCLVFYYNTSLYIKCMDQPHTVCALYSSM